MSGETETAVPAVLERNLPHQDDDAIAEDNGPHVVILYNCDCHTPDEVVAQLLKATDYTLQRCYDIMLEAHTRGRSIAYTGSAEACDRAARILRQIRLQVETDSF
jgi:ATP-dependent Clp protease adapter protein ClpS